MTEPSQYSYAGQWGPEDIEFPDGSSTAGVQVAITDVNSVPIKLYTNQNKTAQMPNPTEVDARGNLSFFADPGVYRMHVMGAIFPITVQVNPNEPIELPAFEGVAWWYGEGPPDVVVGSKAGDLYMDLQTGMIYELE